jgi:hypothetical protein
MNTPRVINRNRARDQRRLLKRMHAASKRKDHTAWASMLAEAERKGFVTGYEATVLRDHRARTLAGEPVALRGEPPVTPSGYALAHELKLKA